jgi:DNA-binding winged helix-turn-helix (wHTH) protein
VNPGGFGGAIILEQAVAIWAMLPRTHPHAVRFGTFEVDFATGELFKSGRKVEIERQPFLVLTALLQTPGELVTREQLRAALWPDGTFVDFDRGLNVAVKKLRDGLGDSSQSPRFIETLARRGYRFIAPVDGRIEPGPPPMAPRQGAYRKYRVWAGVAGIVLTVLIVFAMYRTRLPASTDLASQEFKPVPLTSYPGDERSPALSPDGNTVAFYYGAGRHFRDSGLWGPGAKNRATRSRRMLQAQHALVVTGWRVAGVRR